MLLLLVAMVGSTAVPFSSHLSCFICHLILKIRRNTLSRALSESSMHMYVCIILATHSCITNHPKTVDQDHNDDWLAHKCAIWVGIIRGSSSLPQMTLVRTVENRVGVYTFKIGSFPCLDFGVLLWELSWAGAGSFGVPPCRWRSPYFWSAW